MEPPRLLRVHEVARMLALSVREVWRRVDSGELPRPLRLGNRVRRWLKSEIDAVIDRAIHERGA